MAFLGGGGGGALIHEEIAHEQLEEREYMYLAISSSAERTRTIIERLHVTSHPV